MILLTVGGQGPFDRLSRTVDAWAHSRSRNNVFGQIGPTSYRPEHMTWTEVLDPEEFRIKVAAADAVVAHAGMGTILTALEFGTPILILPRRGHLHEQRNDHQIHTARRMQERGLVEAVFDEAELPAALDSLLQTSRPAAIDAFASADLIRTLADFIRNRGPSTDA